MTVLAVNKGQCTPYQYDMCLSTIILNRPIDQNVFNTTIDSDDLEVKVTKVESNMKYRKYKMYIH